MEIKSYLEKVTNSKFIIRDENGNEICRVVPSANSLLPKNGNRRLYLAKFVSDAINFYSARCDDSELPQFKSEEDKNDVVVSDHE